MCANPALEVELTVRAGAGAAVGVVTEGVDVHAALGVGIVAGDVPGDLGLGGLRGLLEGDGALDVGVTTDDSDCEEVSCQPAVRTSPHLPLEFVNKQCRQVSGIDQVMFVHLRHSSCTIPRGREVSQAIEHLNGRTTMSPTTPAIQKTRQAASISLKHAHSMHAHVHVIQ